MSELFEVGEPASGPEVVTALETMLGAGERYLATLSTEVFLRPQGEKWSPGDHLRHLTKSTFPLERALGLPKLLLALRFGWASAPSRTFAETRAFYRERLGAGANAGRFAPSPRPPGADPEARRREIVAAWRSATTGLAARASGWSEKALDRYRLPHPLLGPLTTREMLFFTVFHGSHHLSSVARRAAEPGLI
jgi:hypothetical protein